MATPEQRDAYRRVINLILEEIEGCELTPDAPETVELRAVADELESRIIGSLPPSQSPPERVTIQRRKDARKFQPKPKKWQSGPLAASTGTAPKPPWFTDA